MFDFLQSTREDPHFPYYLGGTIMAVCLLLSMGLLGWMNDIPIDGSIENARKMRDVMTLWVLVSIGGILAFLSMPITWFLRWRRAKLNHQRAVKHLNHFH
jgi:hypothetical protein